MSALDMSMSFVEFERFTVGFGLKVAHATSNSVRKDLRNISSYRLSPRLRKRIFFFFLRAPASSPSLPLADKARVSFFFHHFDPLLTIFVCVFFLYTFCHSLV